MIGILPSRLGSTRFPRKPLEMILDLPMIEHVRRRALLINGITDVYVATCDEEIKQVVEEFGGKIIMTSDEHTRPSSRVAEAASHLDASSYLMIQGDEPLLIPGEVEKLVDQFNFSKGKYSVLNLIHAVEDEEELSDRNVVKVSLSRSQRIINFSRSPLPCAFVVKPENFYKQSGLIAFSAEALKEFTSVEEGPLELAESIDMLRFLENDKDVFAFHSNVETIGVDLKEHIKRVEDLLKNDPVQNLIYQKTIR
jgi:3-deoxy-manno-octulosonate cytidylyltransferase (CMP-KDO synthetase)